MSVTNLNFVRKRITPQPPPQPKPEIEDGPWTQEQDDQLLDVWLNQPGLLHEVGAVICRSARAVSSRLWKLCTRYEGIDYVPTAANRSMRYGRWTYEDKSILQDCVGPKGVEKNCHDTHYVAGLLCRSEFDVRTMMDSMASEVSELQRRRMTGELEPEMRRAMGVRLYLRGRYGFDKGSNSK